jgi:hypothetical protein
MAAVLKTARGRELPRGFESHTLRSDVAGHRNDPEPTLGFGVFPSAGGSGLGVRWAAGGLVVAGRVDGELAEEFAGGGVDDADVQVLDEQQDAGSGVGPADADVVQTAVDAQGDASAGVEPVGADAVVGVGGPVAWGGFGPGGVGGGRGGAVGQGAVRPLVVIDGGEGVQEGLQLGEVSGPGGLGGQPVLEGRRRVG